jgi:hypothetical protein
MSSGFLHFCTRRPTQSTARRDAACRKRTSSRASDDVDGQTRAGSGRAIGDHESIGRRQNEILRFVLILLLGSLQRRDGRRNNSATAACPSTGSSHCSRRNLESCFSNSFVHVRLAVYRDTPVPLTIDGHRALQDELSGTENGTNVVFLHTTVDDGDHFQPRMLSGDP